MNMPIILQDSTISGHSTSGKEIFRFMLTNVFLINWLFGGGARQVGDVVEQVGGVFRPNAEATASRAH